MNLSSSPLEGICNRPQLGPNLSLEEMEQEVMAPYCEDSSMEGDKLLDPLSLTVLPPWDETILEILSPRLTTGTCALSQNARVGASERASFLYEKGDIATGKQKGLETTQIGRNRASHCPGLCGVPPSRPGLPGTPEPSDPPFLPQDEERLQQGPGVECTGSSWQPR
jgi:hypothetical protein